jgi:hypothetical protein
MAERRGEPSPHYDPATFTPLKDEQYAQKWATRWEGRAANLAKLGIMLQGRRKPAPPKRDHDIGELAHKSGMTIEVLARKMGITGQPMQSTGQTLAGIPTPFRASQATEPDPLATALQGVHERDCALP